jgi:hypothetical protein
MKKENPYRTLNLAFCQICRKTVELKTLEQAAETLKANYNEIKFLAENHQLHRLNNSRGKLKFCAESLFDVLERRPTQSFDEDIFKTNPSGSEIFIGDGS